MLKNEDNTRNLIEKLIRNHRTISTMESCTSGLIASMITDIEGASAIFPGGYVTYSNETKIKVGVDSSIIETYGVYSSECAKAMARTVQKAMETEIAIGITGTTGNIDPNNQDSIQGEVYYCILIGEQEYEYHLKMNVDGMERKEIKETYANAVFEKMRIIL